MISLRSEITKKLLSYFFLNPHEDLYVNELVERLNVDKRNLVKKLRELEAKRLLSCTVKGNLKLYSIRKDFPLFEEYKNIVLRSVGVAQRLKTLFLKVKGIKEAYLYGSCAAGTMDESSDIDVLIIGSHDLIALQKKLNVLQKELNREINVVNMDVEDSRRRRKAKDPFITDVLGKKHIRLI